MKKDTKKELEQIFLSGVESVLPNRLIRSHILLIDKILHVSNKQFPLSDFKNIYLFAVGKASALMAKEFELILGEYITSGEVIVKYGHGCKLQKLKLTEAGHPIPDQTGIDATKRILEIAKKTTAQDLVICLISGGASSLLSDLPEGATLNDLILINELLIACGANINEINTVRKHFSNVKGGQLAKAIYPATTVSLILSDVVGDPIDVIASGPTCPDNSSFSDALAVIKKYKLTKSLPSNLIKHIKSGISGIIAETPKSGEFIFLKVYNFIVGNNKIALKAAQNKAIEYGYSSHILTDSLEGDFILVAQQILDEIDSYQRNFQTLQSVCLLFGGEPTVKIIGTGLGGRNQHLALYLAIKLKDKKGITILCAGTDGTDGPTDAAGAVVDCLTYEKAISETEDAEDYLNNSDSYNFFKKMNGHIITGSTYTNVMDLIIVIIDSNISV